MLVDLLPQGIRGRNPLLGDPSKSTCQSNINRYEAFTHNIKTWITLLPYEISQDASQMDMLPLPTNALAQDLDSQTELVLMITENAQVTTQVPDIDHLGPAASTACQATAGVPLQTDEDERQGTQSGVMPVVRIIIHAAIPFTLPALTLTSPTSPRYPSPRWQSGPSSSVPGGPAQPRLHTKICSLSKSEKQHSNQYKVCGHHR